MNTFNRKDHWDNIYKNKSAHEVSWFQPIPEISLNLINNLNIDYNAEIIDVGGGDSFLVDHLIKLGYKNISLLDISETAIVKTKKRLGEFAKNIDWIISDITAYYTEKRFDLWHDRAAFHFLTTEEDIAKYLRLVNTSLKPGGKLIIGTFSEGGPDKCSGINIRKYSKQKFEKLFCNSFKLIDSFTADHITPFNTVQNFQFCTFEKNKIIKGIK